MVMQRFLITVAVAVTCLASTRMASASDLMYGCRSRPACGKVCQLICDTKTLTVIGYGCECKDICIPGPSKPGCKHCETRCCCDNDIQGCRPKMEFCWYDWFACGCAAPRTVKVLTKYQAEKKIPWYHWEVVDGCNCCCPGGCHCVYKEAPAEAQVGDVLELTDDEQLQVASYLSAGQVVDPNGGAAPIAAASKSPNSESPNAAAKPAAWQRLAKAFSLSDDAK